jgi:hypothetical protein
VVVAAAAAVSGRDVQAIRPPAGEHEWNKFSQTKPGRTFAVTVRAPTWRLRKSL